MIPFPRFVSIVPLCFVLLLSAASASAATTVNHGSCDIGIAPAATLLLPYFDVADSRTGEGTIFTVTNVTSMFQVGRVTLWTDFAYPILSFDLFFEPYEVRRINLYDVIWQGVLDPGGEDSICGPNTLPEGTAARVRRAFRDGVATPTATQAGCNSVGGIHTNAVGYATIDVVGSCASGTTPLDERHFAEDLRFDNVFIGDYQQVNSSQNFAQGSPMVHIRAVPEGGTPQSRRNNPNRYANDFPRTFYGRFQDPAHPTADARQPLPTTFAVRWINGGLGAFQTSFRIWREAGSDPDGGCLAYRKNGQMTLRETIVFDEDDNAEGTYAHEPCPAFCVGTEPIVLPATSLTSLADAEVFPQEIIDTAVSGWIYFNLGLTEAHNTPIQGWVVASMRAEGRYSVDFDAAVLGNGCTPLIPLTVFSEGGVRAVLPGPAADFIP